MKTKYRNVAFLAELLINVLVFSVSCAVLVGLFGKAWQMARDTEVQTRAGVEVQALVETVKARGTAGLAGADPQADGSLLLYYDGAWQPLAPPFADRNAVAYTVRLQVAPEDTGAGTLERISAVATAVGGEVFSLETACYRPREDAA